jgi:hypothetical protein
MILVFHLLIIRLKTILPLENYNLIEHIARDVGKCAVCHDIYPRFLITVNIRPSLYHVEVSEFYCWDQDVYPCDNYDLLQKVCENCESLFRSFSKERYFSQMEFLTDIRSAKTLLN